MSYLTGVFPVGGELNAHRVLYDLYFHPDQEVLEDVLTKLDPLPSVNTVNELGITAPVLIAECLGVEGLKRYRDYDGCLVNTAFRDKMDASEAIRIVRATGYDGLSLWVEAGGRFNEYVRDYDGFSEAAEIAISAGAKGVELFAQYGGKFNAEDPKESAQITEALGIRALEDIQTVIPAAALTAGNSTKPAPRPA